MLFHSRLVEWQEFGNGGGSRCFKRSDHANNVDVRIQEESAVGFNRVSWNVLLSFSHSLVISWWVFVWQNVTRGYCSREELAPNKIPSSTRVNPS